MGLVIAAAGSGVRLGSTLPKQFILLKGKTILQRTIEVFRSVPDIREIVVVGPREHLRKVARIVGRAAVKKKVRIVAGGRHRQDSVWSGLHAFVLMHEVVLVHDAVRPFVSRTLVTRVIDDAHRYGAAVVGVPLRDTIKLEGRKDFCTQTLDRGKLWAVQTPQGFRFDLLLRAHALARRKRMRGTDDAVLVEHLGIPVRIVKGEERNIKITTRQELDIAKKWAK